MRAIPTILFAGLALLAGLAPTAAAAPIFNAPAGCTAIQPPPNGEGVQCYGSDTSSPQVDTASLSFAGTGSGPLWADTVTFEWDFVVEANGLGSIPVLLVAVNGTSDSQIYPRFDLFSERYAGSLTLPYTPGEVLSSWSIQAESIPSVPGSQTLETPLDGIGFRLLADHQPPASAPAPVPEPGTAALTAAALLLVVGRGFRAKLRTFWMKAITLSAICSATAMAGAIFTAPSGCTALAPAPNVTGVQCFGSFGTKDGATVNESISGGGSGPLWANSVTFDWDFVSSGLISRLVQVSASVNGRFGLSPFLGPFFNVPERLTGSLTIPVTFGEELNSWSFSLYSIAATPDGSIAMDIPTTGTGLRLLVTHNPPAPAPVPEPATAFLVVAGVSGMLLRRRGGRQRDRLGPDA
ncbi:MAG: PEP-CTERM sorting domain-containing protein [Bryobacterales bacterium]|nr:PEP-CTERM sorting domain-containing protein [Bryobacterales bacterium]